MNQKSEIMKSLLLEYLPCDQHKDTDIEGLALVRRDTSFEARPAVYKPEIIFVAQGQKHVSLGDKVYTYDPENYFVLTVPIPVICEAVIEEGKPLLGMVLRIDPQVIGEILFEMETPPPPKNQVNNSIYQAQMSDSLLDSLIRLLETLRSKNETKILGPIYVKEILFKVLTGEYGEILRDLAYNNRNLYQISRVISRIHEEYSRPIEIQTLAQEAGMSTSSFHTNFRAITSSSPLQYIKNIRLHKAKELIQQEGEKAYAAAMRVGYESSSQFNREYKRLFGVTPAKDTVEIRAV